MTLSEGTAEDRAPVQLDQQSVGRLSRMDAIQGQALALASDQHRQARKVDLEMVLRHLEASEFGDCVDCGEPISPKRLEIDPQLPYAYPAPKAALALLLRRVGSSFWLALQILLFPPASPGKSCLVRHPSTQIAAAVRVDGAPAPMDCRHRQHLAQPRRPALDRTKVP